MAPGGAPHEDAVQGTAWLRKKYDCIERVAMVERREETAAD
jgi:hypothetical protein